MKTHTHSVDSRKQELKLRIEEMESTLQSLREKLTSEEASAQHDAIDHLEDYLDEVDHKYDNLRDFWKIIRAEFHELFTKKETGE